MVSRPSVAQPALQLPNGSPMRARRTKECVIEPLKPLNLYSDRNGSERNRMTAKRQDQRPALLASLASPCCCHRSSMALTYSTCAGTPSIQSHMVAPLGTLQNTVKPAGVDGSMETAVLGLHGSQTGAPARTARPVCTVKPQMCRPTAAHVVRLLLLSGDAEPNPGPAPFPSYGHAAPISRARALTTAHGIEDDPASLALRELVQLESRLGG